MNKIVLVLIGIVLLGIAAFATLWFRVGGELQELAEDVLIAWREGRTEQIREEATEAFRRGRTLAQHRAYLDLWSRRLGPFVRALGRSSVATSTNERETRKSVTLDLQFEQGEAEGRFDFVVVGETLRLDHLALRRPRAPVERSDRSALEAEARALLGQYGALAHVELFAALSPELQRAWPLATLAGQLGALHAEVGAVQAAVVAETRREAEDRHTLAFDLTFEKRRGRAVVEWLWASERWEIAAFTMESKP